MEQPPRTPTRGTSIALWIITGLPGLSLLAAGAMKLTGPQPMVENFARWGYPPWFLYVTGAIEVAGAVGLFIPRVAPFAALLLGCTMVGAVITHVAHGDARMIVAPLVLLVLVGIVGYARRAPLLRLLGRG
jgi:putative oxidoreductase